MSFAQDDTNRRDLQEEFKYHSEEAEYYLNQYLLSLEETETTYKKFKEHAEYRDQFNQKIREERHA